MDKQSIHPLKWWNVNSKRFLSLAKKAKHMLSMPGMFASSERAFSTAGLVVNTFQAFLSADNVDALVFLNKNTPYSHQANLPARTLQFASFPDCDEEEPAFPHLP